MSKLSISVNIHVLTFFVLQDVRVFFMNHNATIATFPEKSGICFRFNIKYARLAFSDLENFYCVLLFRIKMITYSSTTKNLSPSDPRHLPLLLSRGPSIIIGCRTPDWNHVPSHRSGKKQTPEKAHTHTHTQMVECKQIYI